MNAQNIADIIRNNKSPIAKAAADIFLAHAQNGQVNFVEGDLTLAYKEFKIGEILIVMGNLEISRYAIMEENACLIVLGHCNFGDLVATHECTILCLSGFEAKNAIFQANDMVAMAGGPVRASLMLSGYGSWLGITNNDPAVTAEDLGLLGYVYQNNDILRGGAFGWCLQYLPSDVFDLIDEFKPNPDFEMTLLELEQDQEKSAAIDWAEYEEYWNVKSDHYDLNLQKLIEYIRENNVTGTK